MGIQGQNEKNARYTTEWITTARISTGKTNPVFNLSLPNYPSRNLKFSWVVAVVAVVNHPSQNLKSNFSEYGFGLGGESKPSFAKSQVQVQHGILVVGEIKPYNLALTFCAKSQWGDLQIVCFSEINYLCSLFTRSVMLFVVGEKTKIDSDKNRIAILLSNEKSTQLPHSNQIWKASKDCVNISGSRGRTGDLFFRYQVVNSITSFHNVRSQFGYFRKN